MTLFSFDFLLHFFKSSLATHYVAYFFSLLDVPWEVKRVLAFPQMFGLIPAALESQYTVKQNTNNIIHVVRFNTVTLILISPQTFLSPCLLHVMIHICFSLLRYAYRS